MNFFTKNAAAATGSAQAGQGEGMFSLLMIIAIFVLFYFMLIRPQNKKAKEHKEMLGKLKKGDEVITSGGILGKVTHIGEQYIKISVSETMEITVQRNAINSILPKGTLKSL